MIGVLFEDYARFQAIWEEDGSVGKALKRAQQCKNTINHPLLEGPYHRKILGGTIMYPSWMAYFHRVGFKAGEGVWEALVWVGGGRSSLMLGWVAPFFKKPAIFVRQQANKLLKKVPELEQKLKDTIVDPEKQVLADKFILAMKQFSLVKDVALASNWTWQIMRTISKTSWPHTGHFPSQYLWRYMC